MAVTKAQALVESLVLLDADPQGDAEALEKLAQWALRTFSPLVACDGPDGLIMDVTGADHLHGGPQALLDMLMAKLNAKGFEACAALADSWGAAHALTRFCARPTRCLDREDHGHVLSRLPIGALRLPIATLAALRALGFETVGEVAAQPRAPLTHRFGPDLIRRLDQMFGRLHEPIEPIRPPDVNEVTRIFAEPIGAPETLARYTNKLTMQLCDILENKGLGARQLDLHFIRVDNRIEAVRVSLAQPVRDAKHLTRLLCDKIETVDPGFGIERMRLIASDAEALKPVQISTTQKTTPSLADLIDVLSNRLGPDHIHRLAAMESDVPERAVRKLAPLSADTPEGWPLDWTRPIRLFARPEPIITLSQLPDYPPKVFTWRGERHRVIAADGPERIFGEWWRRDAEIDAIRDYFRVEIEDGRRFWLYRTGDGASDAPDKNRWFLHGLFA